MGNQFSASAIACKAAATVERKIAARMRSMSNDAPTILQARHVHCSWKNFFETSHVIGKKVGRTRIDECAKTCPQLLWISMCKVCTKLG
jgi:hypothetical protein